MGTFFFDIQNKRYFFEMIPFWRHVRSELLSLDDFGPKSWILTMSSDQLGKMVMNVVYIDD